MQTDFLRKPEIAPWLRSLRPSEKLCLAMTIPGILQRTARWTPQSVPQWQALLSPADELFYGGQAGGGKSDLLLGLALVAHQRSIIFRREFAQLTALVERSRELLADVAQYNGQQHIWHGIPGGRTLEFGGVQLEDDKRKYQGRPHDLKAFDEVTEFTESQYRYLGGWARTTDAGQRVRIVATGNPPSHADGRWVIQHWAPWLDDRHAHPAQPGVLRWYAVLDGKDTEVDGPATFLHGTETIRPTSRTFIPARLSDNPYLRDSGYSAVLQGLPEPLRTQLLYGDFNITMDDDPWQTIPTAWVRAAFERYAQTRPDMPLAALGVDVARGGSDQTVICKRYGTWLPPLLKFPGRQTDTGPKAAAQVLLAMGGSQCTVFVDVIGVGGSVVDSLAGTVPVHGINFAEASKATDKSGRLQMRNKRAECYWRLREALDPVTGDNLAIAPDNELLADLTAPRWSITASGILIESKEDIIGRLGRSPDCGDAVALAVVPQPWLVW